jgi:hypothetical protein
MSSGWGHTATRYHRPLSEALGHATEQERGRVLTKAEVVAIYERHFGELDESEKSFMLPSDHCDKPTTQASTATGLGRCEFCVGGTPLLERVDGRNNQYRILVTAGSGDRY